MRGEWIEIIFIPPASTGFHSSLPMRGEWIEILFSAAFSFFSSRLSPCGESGLKLDNIRDLPAADSRSLPMRGEWIEISSDLRFPSARRMSLPMRGEWIEICVLDREREEMSLPMRGEWIEISAEYGTDTQMLVSPHAGRVD